MFKAEHEKKCKIFLRLLDYLACCTILFTDELTDAGPGRSENRAFKAARWPQGQADECGHGAWWQAVLHASTGQEAEISPKRDIGPVAGFLSEYPGLSAIKATSGRLPEPSDVGQPMGERDAKGRFVAGGNPNPTGKTGQTKAAALKAILEQVTTPGDIKAIWKQLVIAAKGGDADCATIVFDRLWGKPKQPVEHEGDVKITTELMTDSEMIATARAWGV